MTMQRLLFLHSILIFCFLPGLSAQETAESIRDKVYHAYQHAVYYQDSSFLNLTIEGNAGQVTTTVNSKIRHFRTGSFHFHAQVQTNFSTGSTSGQLEATICKPQGQNIATQMIRLGPPEDQVQRLPLAFALGGLDDITAHTSSRIPSLLFEDFRAAKPLGDGSKLKLHPESLHPDSLHFRITQFQFIDPERQSNARREYEDAISSAPATETCEEYWIRKTDFLIVRIKGSNRKAGQTPDLYHISIFPTLKEPAKPVDCQ